MSENGYIQGAGDDCEGWSRGLSPALFWANKEQLLGATEEIIADIILRVNHMKPESSAEDHDAVKIGSTSLYVGSLPDSIQLYRYDGVVICSNLPQEPPSSKFEETKSKKLLHLHCSGGKLGSRALRSHLSRIPTFITSLRNDGKPPNILLACSTGDDLSVGVALAVLCLFFDDSCKFSSKQYLLSLGCSPASR